MHLYAPAGSIRASCGASFSARKFYMEGHEMEYRLIGYKNEFGEICCPEGFLDELKDRSIENQVKRYRWVWGKVSLEQYPAYLESLRDRVSCPDEKTVIVKDGIVVGFYRYTSEQYPNNHFVLPFQSITYYCSDNNGAGYKESLSYRTLICW